MMKVLTAPSTGKVRSQSVLLDRYGERGNRNVRRSYFPLGIGSQPEEPGTITMSVALLKQADNAHLRGFKITPAGAPNPVSRP